MQKKGRGLKQIVFQNAYGRIWIAFQQHHYGEKKNFKQIKIESFQGFIFYNLMIRGSLFVGPAKSNQRRVYLLQIHAITKLY